MRGVLVTITVPSEIRPLERKGRCSIFTQRHNGCAEDRAIAARPDAEPDFAVDAPIWNPLAFKREGIDIALGRSILHRFRFFGRKPVHDAAWLADAGIGGARHIS